MTAANGGTFAVINTTVRTRPTIAVALQAAGRAAASMPLAQASEDAAMGAGAAEAGGPNGHKVLDGASGLALASNGIAYVTGSRSGAVAAIDATDPAAPRVAREIVDSRLLGATDLCAVGGDAGSAVAPGAGEDAPDGTGPAVLFAIVPAAQRLVVLLDSGGGTSRKKRSEL